MKTVIEMAIEAGVAFDSEEYPDIWMTYMNVGRKEIEAFAELVRADAIADAVEREREACAKIVETPVGEYKVVVACGGDPTERRIPMYLSWNQAADAIRARGETSLRSNT